MELTADARYGLRLPEPEGAELDILGIDNGNNEILRFGVKICGESVFPCFLITGIDGKGYCVIQTVKI